MESDHIAAFVCSHVFEGSRPVLYVCTKGGDWQLLCGEGHGEDELPEVVGLNHLLARDETLREILDLNDDWQAERERVGSPWVRSACSNNEKDDR